MLTVKNLCVSYGAVKAVSDVSLHVNDGEIVSLIGSNGAGKTTILRTISGLEKPVSGVITFVAVGILLWLLGTSLSSPEGFEQASAIMGSFFVKFIMWGILTALAYHVVVGIRHMMMDFGYLEETFEAGKRSAKISFVITVVLSLLAGVLVW